MYEYINSCPSCTHTYIYILYNVCIAEFVENRLFIDMYNVRYPYDDFSFNLNNFIPK